MKAKLITRLSGLSITIAITSGCVAFPFPSNETTGGHKLLGDKKVSTSFVPGKTTRHQVLNRLGEPDGAINEGEKINYRWRKQHVILVYGTENSSGTSKIYGTNRRLVISFDENGFVQKSEMLSQADWGSVSEP